MPIRLPKGFARRRSSGNALDEVPLPNPPEPSFKVFARRPSASKSFDGGNSAQYIADGRPKSAGHYLENFPSENDRYNQHLSNRGSGGTNNSSSSGGLFDAPSSARFSSSSTLPSTSSNEGIRDEYSHAHPKPVYGLPQSASQPTFSLRAKGRTFSFGKKLVQQQKQPSSPAEHQPQVPGVTPIRDVPAIPRPLSRTWGVEDTGSMYSRPRAMTDQSYASESTAKPPVLPVTSIDFQTGDGSDDFGSIFQDYDSPRFHTAPTSAASSHAFDRLAQDDQPPKVPPKGPSFPTRSSYATPPPLSVNHSRAITPSPYSHDSQDSRDGLLYNQSPGLNPKNSPYLPDTAFQPPRSIVDTRVSLQSSTNSSNSPTRDRPSNLRRTSAYSNKRASTPLHDTDAALVMDSINASKSLNRQSVTFEDSPRPIISRKSLPTEPKNPAKLTPYTHYNYSGPEALGGRHNSINLYDEPEEDVRALNTWHDGSLESTPRAQKPELSQPIPNSELQPEDSELLFDPVFQEMARSAEQIETGRLSPPPQLPQQNRKVMTPAQYEKYRKEKEMSSVRSTSSKDSSDDEDDHYDDEDEAERTRQVVKQRRKQEAHLSVYRQQMMKVTGEQPKTFDLKRPEIGTSYSMPDLVTRMSATNLRAGNNGKNSDDEDEDVPLGILAAHGFPSKDRQPGKLDRTNSTPMIRYQSETYPPPSAAGGSVAGGPPGSLPPFARNLPKDPYFGASLVSPSNREAAGFGNTGGGSVYGGSQVGSPHPAGLVGVIASEEKARAMRRGSPNTQAGWGGNPLPQGMIPMGTSLSPGDQAQIQMSQQMQQMMQMQMQWMQNMMAMQQHGQQTLAPPQMPFVHGQMPPMPTGGFLPPQNPNMLRPMSMGSNVVPSPQAQQQQRAMSMLTPNMSQQWGQQPSRNTGAPSMMSGALGGQGYAPSIAPSERSNIGQPTRYRPVSTTANEKGSRSNTLSPQNMLQGWNSGNPGGVQATAKAVSGGAKGKQTVGKGSEDEDDDAGWKELKANREKKKSSWKLKKREENGLSDLYYGT